MTRRNTAAAQGFTLLELLATVVILSMIAGAFSGSLFAPTEVARVRELMGQLRSLDASARLYARSDGPIMIATSAGAVTMSTRSTLLRAVQLKETERVQFRTTSGDSHLWIDRLGESPDYEAVVITEEAVAVLFRVHGLTGLVAEGGQTGAR